MGSISGPGGAPKRTIGTWVNGVRAQPFLRPGAAWLKEHVQKNAGRIIANYVNKGKSLEDACNLFLIGAADAGRVIIQGLAPKDTRLLSGSINVKKRAVLNYTIGTNVEYAIFQEFGTGIYGPLGKAYLIPPRMNLPPGMKRKTKEGKFRKSGGENSGPVNL